MRRRQRPTRALLTAVGAVIVWSLLAVLPARAAEPVFGTPTIEGSLGNGLQVTQPVTLDAVPDRVEVLITYAASPGPFVIELPPPPSGETTLRHALLSDGDHLPPNTPVAVRWRITTDGTAVVGPDVRMLYEDKRFDWQTVSGDIVRVHWYEGGREFGERALRIGERAVKETADLLGVTEDEPVDFFIYADRPAFTDALGPGTTENVGGQANVDIRTLFALIGPSQIDDPWVENVVPHELVHLVYGTAVDNPYHFPPLWLTEGLAVYLAKGYDAEDRGAVESAARSGELIPLDGLVGVFPRSAEKFSLSYAESASAVDFLIRTHGRDALVSLIRSYAEGRTDDEALEAAIGQTVAEFNDAWLADLGAVAPVRHGPRPAPTAPTDPAAPTAPNDPTAPTTGGTSAEGLLLAAALGAVVVIAVILVLRDRARRPRPPSIAPGPWP